MEFLPLSSGTSKETNKTVNNMSAFTRTKVSTESAAKRMSRLIAKNYGGRLVKDNRVIDKVKSLVKSAKASIDPNYFVSCALVKRGETYIFAVANYLLHKPHVAVFDIYAEYNSIDEFLNSDIDPVELVLLPL